MGRVIERHGFLLAAGCTGARPASAVFSPAELDARLEALAELHAVGEAAAGDAGRGCCAGCGRESPRPSPGWAERHGWTVSQNRASGEELYCPPCWAAWRAVRRRFGA